MDVNIGEVQAQVEAPSTTPRQGGPAQDDGKQLGPTEKAHQARLAERRANRIRERLNA